MAFISRSQMLMKSEFKYKPPDKLSSLSIVLPAHNEQDNIKKAILEAVKVAKTLTKKYEVIVVNDGSSDNTLKSVEEISTINEHVRLLNNQKNLGYGPTLRRGLGYAKNQWVFFTDADNQFDMNELSRLVRYTDAHDFIIGKRTSRKDPIRRRLNAWVFNTAVKMFFGIKVKDVDCAFKLMRRSKLRSFDLISESAMINTEVLHRAKIAGFKIKQIAVTHRPRVYGESTGGDRDVIKRAIKEFYILRWVLLKTEDARMKLNTRVVFFVSLTAGVLATWWSYKHHVILAYGDAEAHLNIAKQVTDSLTPGIAQLGGIWLPLPHLLMVPFVIYNPLWSSGIGGSIVSVAAFIWLCIMAYKLAYEITRSFSASYLAPLILIANPNSLYFATTPMTEILLLSMFTSSVYFFTKWLRRGALTDLLIASVFTFLATLSRYDGWALVVVETAIILFMLLIKRIPLRVLEGVTVLYSFIAYMGIILWLLWNKLIFNSFLYFSNSVYGSKVQQQFFLKNGYLPTYHNLGKSIIYFLEDIRLVVGLPVIAISLVGMLVFTIHAFRKREMRLLFVILLALTPVLFYVVSLYIGQASLLLPPLAKAGAKYTLSNSRYGIQILLFIALFISFLGGKYKKTIPIIALIVLIQSFSFIKTNTVITYVDGTQGLSSQKVSKGPDAPAVEQFMRQHYDNGLVWMDDYRRPIGIVESGIPMDRFIGSGNKPYWNDSFDNPGKYAKWIILQKADSDAVWRGIKDKSLIDQEFSLVFNKGDIFVYKKRITSPKIVRQSGQHLMLNGKSFVINGVNSYDILTQPDTTILSRLNSMEADHFNTLRTWCFDSNGTLNSAEFAHLDYLLQQAETHNIKVVCVLGNMYNNYGGPAHFQASSNLQFFTDQRSITDYEKYISTVLNHKSKLTALENKNSPAILAWELINEPRVENSSDTAVSNWMQEIGEYVDSIDQSHLISPGTEGFTSSYPGQPYNENHGSSIENICSLEVITLCSAHLYPKYIPTTNNGQIDYAEIGNVIHAWRYIANNLNKPIYVGEVGYDLSNGSQTSRSAYFSNIRQSLLSNKIDGALIWNVGNTADSSYTLQFGDPSSDNILSNWGYTF